MYLTSLTRSRRHWRCLALSLIIALTTLSACQSETPTPRSLASPTVTPTDVAVVIDRTPSPTPMATPTPTASPTATSPVNATATVAADPLTATAPTAVQPPRPTPLPGATTVVQPPEGPPAPVSAGTLVAARQLQAAGNHAAARAQLQQFLSAPADAVQWPEAYFHLGESLLADGLYREAADAFAEFLRLAPGHPRQADAYFHQGEAYRGLGLWPEAVAAYREYLQAGSSLLTYEVQLRLAGVHVAAGDTAAAAAAYAAAVAAAPDRVTGLRAREQWAAYAATVGDHAASLAQYQAILGEAQNAGYQAEINQLAGNAAWNAGNAGQAETYWRAAVALAPRSNYAYQALIQLVNNQLPVDWFTRGLVDYHNRAYLPAINALTTYLQGEPDARRGEALAYLARSYQGAEDYANALATWDRLINDLPSDPAWGDAWLGKAETHRFAGDRPSAVTTLRTFVNQYPDHPLAADVRYELALQLERLEQYAEAADHQVLLADTAPAHKQAARALLRAGVNRYRLGDVARAVELWQRGVRDYGSSADAPALHLWLGKGHLAQQQSAEANAAWDTLLARWPESYAAARARVLRGDAPPREPDGATLDGLPDNGSQATAETWLRSWIAQPDARENLATLDDRIAQDPDWQRGQAYLALHLRGPALEALEKVRTRYWEDPLALYQLALAFQELGTYRLSILSAARLIALSPQKLVTATPLFIQKLAYPRYFDAQVQEEAQRFGVDPLLVDAVIRQESLFEAGAESSAAARGLMQVIPSTGEWIAGELNFPDYTTSDLYRPWVSIKFGTFYIMRGLRAADGNVATALVGYNAGPSNGRFWRERSGPDEDLFYETVSLSEPRAYLSLITTHYAHYARLYADGRDLLDARMDRSRWAERPAP